MDNLLDSVWSDLVSKDGDRFRLDLAEILELGLGRVNSLYEYIKGKSICDSCKLDIQAYLAKQLRRDKYDLNPLMEHDYSVGTQYCYDPAKNGQNILKHGLSFGEVVSYSKYFGMYIVRLEDKVDNERAVLFSDLKYLRDVGSLCFPLPKISSDCVILNIVKFCDKNQFRIISSRQVSSNRNKYIATIRSSLREDGYTKEGLERLTDEVIDYLEKVVFPIIKGEDFTKLD